MNIPIFVKFKNNESWSVLVKSSDPANILLNPNVDQILMAPEDAQDVADYDFMVVDGLWQYELNQARKESRLQEQALKLKEYQTELEIEAQVALVESRAAVGRKVIALMSYLNAIKGLSIEQTLALLNDKDLMFIESCLRTGALETAMVLISGYKPDGQMITNNDKQTILDYLGYKV